MEPIVDQHTPTAPPTPTTNNQNTGIEPEYQVVIVGCGPNGSCMANLLGQLGIKTLILDQQETITTVPRAAHLDDDGIRVLQNIGLEKEILDHSYQLTVKFNREFDNKPLATIPSSQTDFNYPRSIFWNQPFFESVLRNGFERFSCVKLQTSSKVVGIVKMIDMEKDGRTVYNIVKIQNKLTDSIQSVKCRFVIGADGGNSNIRKMMNTRFPGENGDMRWLVIDAILDEDHPKLPHYFQFICNPTRPALALPIPPDHYRWEFGLFEHEDAEKMESEENVFELLTQHGAVPEKLKIVRKSVYSFMHRIADKWFDGDSILLIGDAAHCVPPFLGLGISSGFRDCMNLSWKLDLLLRGVLKDTAILHTYQWEREPNVATIIEKAKVAGSIIMTTNVFMAAARNLIFNTVFSIPYFEKFLHNKGMMKPLNKITRGFVEEINIQKSYTEITGAPIVQPLVKLIYTNNQVVVNNNNNNDNNNNNNNNKKIDSILLDHVLGKGFGLLIVCPEEGIDHIGEMLFGPITSSPSMDDGASPSPSPSPSPSTHINHKNNGSSESSLWSLLKTNFIHIIPNQHYQQGHKYQPPSFINSVVVDDSNETLVKLLTNSPTIGLTPPTPTVALVRPDRHIFGIYQNHDEIHTIEQSIRTKLKTNEFSRLE
ncbi:hypothetical protein CYY_005897 [Polysphondylium violaceum]|uniref:FAD-binding domain-containing protein n=1 Tax=Polysphondylium violaceum TaxID=133409 RepID=A0A8J4URV6_9MYCE|nr:hypothetical protein CYY_005897 [Polysphondylium violaceum]